MSENSLCMFDDSASHGSRGDVKRVIARETISSRSSVSSPTSLSTQLAMVKAKLANLKARSATFSPVEMNEDVPLVCPEPCSDTWSRLREEQSMLDSCREDLEEWLRTTEQTTHSC